MNKILLVLLVALLMAGCGDDAVEKLEQRVDELEDELEQVKRDQSYSQGRQRSLFGLFGSNETATQTSDSAKSSSPTRAGPTEEKEGAEFKRLDGADTEGGQPLDTEPSGEEKYYELTGLITNLGGPIKSRYINIELKLEGLAGDFEKLIEINEHRLRNKALTIMGQYTYEDAQLDGFQERVRVELKKGFSIVLKKYRNGESDLIRNIYFTQFIVQ